jgi:hypothetical protein
MTSHEYNDYRDGNLTGLTESQYKHCVHFLTVPLEQIICSLPVQSLKLTI